MSHRRALHPIDALKDAGVLIEPEDERELRAICDEDIGGAITVDDAEAYLRALAHARRKRRESNMRMTCFLVLAVSFGAIAAIITMLWLTR